MSMNPDFCVKCGAQLVPGNNFCENCGAPVLVRVEVAEGETQQKTAVGAAPTAVGTGSVCPKCGKADLVTAVVSFYEKDQFSVDNYDIWLDNKKEDEYTNEDNDDDSSEQKRPASLTEKLAPPNEPKYTSRIVYWAIMPFIPVLNAIMIWFAPMGRKMKISLLFTGMLLAIAWVIQTRTEKHLQSLKTAYYVAVEENLVHVGPFTILDAPFLIGFLFLVFYFVGLIMENTRRKAYFSSIVVPAYNNALARWRKLCYCSRCDGVFGPEPFHGKPNFVPAGRMRTLLYEKRTDK